jgi:hypothetical protein
MLTTGSFFNFSFSSFCNCNAFLALAKASREDRVVPLPGVGVPPSVLDLAVTSSDLILTPSFSLVLGIDGTFVVIIG